MQLTLCPRPYFGARETVIVEEFVGPFARATLTEDIVVLGRLGRDLRWFRYSEITHVHGGFISEGDEYDPMWGLVVSDRHGFYIAQLWRPKRAAAAIEARVRASRSGDRGAKNA
jgi:hypothetical protein